MRKKHNMPDHSYITLSEASEYTPFDSNYLGLLIRKGRFLGVKKKGKWYTTREAIDRYMKSSARVKISEEKTEPKSRAKFLLTHIGAGSFLFAALLLCVAVLNAYFFEDAKRDVAQISITQAESADGKPVAVSESGEVGSFVARR